MPTNPVVPKITPATSTGADEDDTMEFPVAPEPEPSERRGLRAVLAAGAVASAVAATARFRRRRAARQPRRGR